LVSRKTVQAWKKDGTMADEIEQNTRPDLISQGGFMPEFAMRVLTLAALFLSSWSPHAGADAVLDWSANAGKAVLAACIAPNGNPFHESRMYAMMQIAVHDALNAIHRRFHPYALDIQGPSGASPEAAVATAARDVLVPLINQLPATVPQACKDDGVASIEDDYVAALEAIADGAAKTQGIAIGHAAAAVILAVRVADGSDVPLLDFNYPQGTAPGEWRFTPGLAFAIAQGWADVMPFALRDSAQFRPGPPYKLSQ
jgi:hypothetical protein